MSVSDITEASSIICSLLVLVLIWTSLFMLIVNLNCCWLEKVLKIKGKNYRTNTHTAMECMIPIASFEFRRKYVPLWGINGAYLREWWNLLNKHQHFWYVYLWVTTYMYKENSVICAAIPFKVGLIFNLAQKFKRNECLY